jgi:hypothetical protein
MNSCVDCRGFVPVWLGDHVQPPGTRTHGGMAWYRDKEAVARVALVVSGGVMGLGGEHWQTRS